MKWAVTRAPLGDALQTFFFSLIVTTRESWLDREIESIIKYRVYMTVIEDHQLIHVGWRPADGCHDSRSLSSCTMSRRVCVSVFSRCIYSSTPPPPLSFSYMLLGLLRVPWSCSSIDIRGNACGLVFAAQLWREEVILRIRRQSIRLCSSLSLASTIWFQLHPAVLYTYTQTHYVYIYRMPRMR